MTLTTLREPGALEQYDRHTRTAAYFPADIDSEYVENAQLRKAAPIKISVG